MNQSSQLLILRLEDQRYALHLSVVERVVRMVETTPLPDAPDIVLGLINLQGSIIPVLDLRRPFRLPAREAQPEDVLVIARVPGRRVALAADAIDGIIAYPEQAVVTDEEILPLMAYVEGVVKLADGLVLICDLDRLLALDERGGGTGA